MIDIEKLIEIDKLATLSINGSDSLFLDNVASIFTSVYIWIPLSLLALYVVIRNVGAKKILPVILLIVITVVLCDQLSSSVAKPYFERLRPTRDPSILDLVDTVGGYRGGKFGFFSSHAANSFGLAVLFMWIIRDLWFGLSIAVWASLNSLIRVYLGVHFLGDILVGAVAGTVLATLVYWTYRLFVKEKSFNLVHIDRFSNKYTSSGFYYKDIYMLHGSLLGSYALIFILACII